MAATSDTPVPLSSLNTPGIDAAPAYFSNERGRPQLFFASTRGNGVEDIYVSELQTDGEWGTPESVFELNTPDRREGRASIRSDGLEIVFDSNRDGDGSQTELYASHRKHLRDPWSIPEKIAGAVNLGGFVARPALSDDGRSLYFTFLTDQGHLDLLVSTRALLRHGHRDR